MAQTTIEWTAVHKPDGTVLPGFTFNPWLGCTRVSSGCINCYAETMMDQRYGKVKWGPHGLRVRTGAAYWKQPLKWNRQAADEGVRRRVFCASLADVFEDKVDQAEDLDLWRGQLFSLIKTTPHLDWLLLTKRPENVLSMIPRTWREDRLPPNAWLGTSVENQESADRRIPELLRIPAAVRFLSCEPLLGPLDLSAYLVVEVYAVDVPSPKGGLGYPPTVEAARYRQSINWVIVGGESGPKARPMHPAWARSLRDQCQEAAVAFHFKQWGEWVSQEEWHGKPAGITDMPWYDLGDSTRMLKVGKHRAGRLLDGREWNEFPETNQ